MAIVALAEAMAMNRPNHCHEIAMGDEDLRDAEMTVAGPGPPRIHVAIG